MANSHLEGSRIVNRNLQGRLKPAKSQHLTRPTDHALNIDFVNQNMGLSTRVAVELSPESAKKLAQTILTTLARGENVMRNSDSNAI